MTLEAGQPSPLAEIGKRIYREGVDPRGGEIVALVGPGKAEVTAALFPCAQCHGHDGLGRAEGGVVPSDIRWETLSKPYGVRHTDRRNHPPYDASSLKRAFTMGFDPAGNELHAVMPRYQLTYHAAEALVAYLKVLGAEVDDPGLTEDRIRLGVLLPPAGRLSPMGDAIRAVLNAYFEWLHQRGGIYSRQVELRFLTLPAGPEARPAAVRSFVEHKQIFALVASYLSEADEPISAELQELQAPLVGAFSLSGDQGGATRRYVFYLLTGLRDQARALFRFGVQKVKDTAQRVAVVHADREELAAVARTISAEAASRGLGPPWSEMETVEYRLGALDTRALVESQRRQGTDVLFFLGTGPDTQRLLKAVRSTVWRPLILLCSALAGDGILSELDLESDHVYLSFATLPSDKQQHKALFLRGLAAKYNLPSGHRSVQQLALAAAEMLTHALQEAGRNVSREKLIDVLESLHGYESGLTPRITYGPRRRVGASGAYVVSLGADGVRSSDWIDVR